MREHQGCWLEVDGDCLVLQGSRTTLALLQGDPTTFEGCATWEEVVERAYADQDWRPVIVGFDGEGSKFYLYKEHVFEFADLLGYEEVWDSLDAAMNVRQSRRLREHRAVQGDDLRAVGRPHIPQAVRLSVFERDGGACVDCGARVDLQFDHVIPLTMGGSSTAANLQLLCASCNAAKGTSL